MPLKPTRKVAVGAFAGALTVIALYIVKASTGHSVPGEVAAAITTVVSTGLSWLIADK